MGFPWATSDKEEIQDRIDMFIGFFESPGRPGKRAGRSDPTSTLPCAAALQEPGISTELLQHILVKLHASVEEPLLAESRAKVGMCKRSYAPDGPPSHDLCSKAREMHIYHVECCHTRYTSR